MKNHKQILEAVNRGIQLALDDFDDEDQVQNVKSKQVQNRDYTKEYLDFQNLIKKFESECNTSKDILELGELHKIIGLKYKITSDRLYNFVRNYLNKTESLYHADLNWIDTSGIYTMDNLFYESNFDGDISEWDVSNVKSMVRMFYHSYFNGNISKWNVSNVKSMYEMFTSSWFKGDISNWDVSNVESMHGMFQYTNFNNDISGWDVFKCRDFENMFMNDTLFYQDLSNWKIKKGSDTNMMFWGTKIVTYLKYMPQFV